MRRNRSVAATLGAALLASLGLVLVSASAASASCVAPSAHVSPRTVPANGWVTVTGTGWMSDCPDTGGPLPSPAAVDVQFVQGDRTETIATVTADAGYALEATVALPDWAAAGPAAVVVGDDATHVNVTAAVDGIVPPDGTLGVPADRERPSGRASLTSLVLLALLAGVAVYPWIRFRRRQRAAEQPLTPPTPPDAG